MEKELYRTISIATILYPTTSNVVIYCIKTKIDQRQLIGQSIVANLPVVRDIIF